MFVMGLLNRNNFLIAQDFSAEVIGKGHFEGIVLFLIRKVFKGYLDAIVSGKDGAAPGWVQFGRFKGPLSRFSLIRCRVQIPELNFNFTDGLILALHSFSGMSTVVATEISTRH